MSVTTQKYYSYEKLELLNRGNFGAIYKIKRKSDEQILSWKVQPCLTEEEHVEMQRTANLLDSLKHPNIVTQIDAFKHKENFFTVQEYCAQGSLESLYKKKKQNGEFISEPEAWRILQQLASATAYLHQNHILHRNLKPQSIMLTSDGTVKVGGFALAIVIEPDKETGEGAAVGVPYYISPELYKEGKQGFPSDIWGIGLIMQEILSQKRPIDGKPSELDQMRVNGQVIKPIDPSHYSQELIELVSALRRVNPNERPTIRQILEADSSSKTTAHSVLASQEAAASIKDE